MPTPTISPLRRVRWCADGSVLRIGGGGLAVEPGMEFDVDAAVADELVASGRADAVGWTPEHTPALDVLAANDTSLTDEEE